MICECCHAGQPCSCCDIHGGMPVRQAVLDDVARFLRSIPSHSPTSRRWLAMMIGRVERDELKAKTHLRRGKYPGVKVAK